MSMALRRAGIVEGWNPQKYQWSGYRDAFNIIWEFQLRLQIFAPLPIGFAVFLVHLATIPITGTGINPVRSLGAAISYSKKS